MVSFTKIILTVGAVVGYALAHHGDMTYYDVGLGSCGWTNGDGDPVVAMSPSEMKCGKQIKIKYKNKSTTVKIVDKCMGCAAGSIDVSPAVFQIFEPLGVGRVPVDWEYV